MSDENTTPAGTPANLDTIGEQELFAEFVRHGFGIYDPFTGEPLVTQSPLAVLQDGGVNGALEGIADSFAEIVHSAVDPLQRMEELSADMKDYALGLDRLCETYRHLQLVRSVGEIGDEPRYTLRDQSWPSADMEFQTNLIGPDFEDDAEAA